MASLISIRIVCYCPAHSAPHWICICAAPDTHTHTHTLQALIHLLPALSTNNAIFVFIVLLIHKIHFFQSNYSFKAQWHYWTLLLIFLERPRQKQSNKQNQAPAVEVKDNIWYKHSSSGRVIVMYSRSPWEMFVSVKCTRGIGHYCIN